MNDKEVYLINLEWTKIQDNMGGVKGDLIFKDNMSYEEFKEILKETYFILNNKRIQSNWNSLRECVDYQLKHNVGSSAESSIRNHVYQEIKDKMNELESGEK